MTTFAVLSETVQPALRASISAQFPDAHFHWSDTVSFVRSSGTAKDLARRLGVKTRTTEGTVEGTIGAAVVTSLGTSYFGWSKASLWEWLRTSHEASE